MTICRSAGGSPRGRRCGTAGAAGARLLAFTAVLLIQCARAPSPKCPPEHKTVAEQRAAGEALIQSAARGRLEDGAAALACFRKALKQTRPADAQMRGELMVLVADALEAAGDLPASDAQLRTVLKEFPTSPVPHFKLGNQVTIFPHDPPWRQPRGKSMVSLVISLTNATRIGWHLWEIDFRFPPGLPPGRRLWAVLTVCWCMAFLV